MGGIWSKGERLELLESFKGYRVWTLNNVKEAVRQFEVSRQKSRYSYSITFAEFRMLFQLSLANEGDEAESKIAAQVKDDVINAEWRLWDDKNLGKVNFLEICSGITMVCSAHFKSKIGLLFDLFDFDSSGTFSKNELSVLTRALMTALCKMTGNKNALPVAAAARQVVSDFVSSYYASPIYVIPGASKRRDYEVITITTEDLLLWAVEDSEAFGILWHFSHGDREEIINTFKDFYFFPDKNCELGTVTQIPNLCNNIPALIALTRLRPNVVGFSTEGALKKFLRPQDEWIHTVPQNDPDILQGLFVRLRWPGWQFHPFMDAPGGDIDLKSDLANNIAELMAAADDDHNIVAFNTSGFFKQSVAPPCTWTQSYTRLDRGLFVRRFSGVPGSDTLLFPNLQPPPTSNSDIGVCAASWTPACSGIGTALNPQFAFWLPRGSIMQRKVTVSLSVDNRTSRPLQIFVYSIADQNLSLSDNYIMDPLMILNPDNLVGKCPYLVSDAASFTLTISSNQKYVIIPTTKTPTIDISFHLAVQAKDKKSVCLRPCTEPQHFRQYGCWNEDTNTCGGYMSLDNPQFLVSITRATPAAFVVSRSSTVTDSDAHGGLVVLVYRLVDRPSGKEQEEQDKKEAVIPQRLTARDVGVTARLLSISHFVSSSFLSHTCTLPQAGQYIVVVCQQNKGVPASFTLDMKSLPSCSNSIFPVPIPMKYKGIPLSMDAINKDTTIDPEKIVRRWKVNSAWTDGSSGGNEKLNNPQISVELPPTTSYHEEYMVSMVVQRTEVDAEEMGMTAIVYRLNDLQSYDAEMPLRIETHADATMVDRSRYLIAKKLRFTVYLKGFPARYSILLCLEKPGTVSNFFMQARISGQSWIKPHLTVLRELYHYEIRDGWSAKNNTVGGYHSTANPQHLVTIKPVDSTVRFARLYVYLTLDGTMDSWETARYPSKNHNQDTGAEHLLELSIFERSKRLKTFDVNEIVNSAVSDGVVFCKIEIQIDSAKKRSFILLPSRYLSGKIGEGNFRIVVRCDQPCELTPLKAEPENLMEAHTESKLNFPPGMFSKLQPWDPETIENISNACLENGVLFEDPHFLPGRSSLSQGAGELVKETRWQRLGSFSTELQLWDSVPEAEDIQQNQLHWQWFCQVVSAVVSQCPHLVMEMITPNRVSPTGVYGVKVWTNGTPHMIIVDDFVPTGEDNKPLYGRCSRSSLLWYSLLEKAYAKAGGCYEHMNMNNSKCLGYPAALQSMLGSECFQIEVDKSVVEDPTVWNVILNLQRVSNFLVTCFPRPGRAMDDRGLSSRYSYVVAGGLLIEGERLVRLRMVWTAQDGEEAVKWNGKWGRSSKEVAKMSLAPWQQRFVNTTGDNNLMDLPFADFSAYFGHIFVTQLSKMEFPFSQLIEDHWSHPFNLGYGSAMNPQFALTFSQSSLEGQSEPSSHWIRIELSIPPQFVDKCGLSITIARKPLIPGLHPEAIQTAGKKRIHSIEPGTVVAQSTYNIAENIVLEHAITPSKTDFFVVIPSFGPQATALDHKEPLIPFRLSILSREPTKLYR